MSARGRAVTLRLVGPRCLDPNQAFLRLFLALGADLISIGAMQNVCLLKVALALCLAGAAIGCERAPKSDDNAQHYTTRGIVRGFSPDRSIISIEHETIPDFMPSMTMPFSARDQKEIVGLKLGAAISFRMIVTEKDFWIDNVKKIGRNEVQVAEPSTTPTSSSDHSERLRDGDAMPFFSLTNQNGEHITLETFHDQPLILTFVFTRCPIPNFCPRISSNFAELQQAIKAGHGALAKTHLLSITLDPSFDTPEILKQYGEHHGADSKAWSFATGDPKEIDELTHAFAVYVQTEGGTISHGLATALVDRNGNIVKIWRGNGWTPTEIIAELGKAAK